eukprot:TRINITY_DN104833_c0_g1_i1.p1 TRINITY_DN104833_c0_g1~~TRINITY_DN104833_c0_g1_i1.p1  ORF type:complete len:569 (+),score=86.57 TRINITY_DN104833_c0_g1_i1:120-1826(+)
MYTKALFAACVLGAVVVLGASTDRVMMHTRSTNVPAAWKAVAPSPKDAVVPLRFVVKQRNLDILQTIVDDISNPKSANYANYLSLEELRELTRDAEAVATVRKFLSEFDVVDSRSTINEEIITVKVTVQTAETMLGAPFTQYMHENGEIIHRCDFYTLPADVAAAVEFVGHTTSLPNLTHRSVITTVTAKDPAANGQATPSVISQYYGITDHSCKQGSFAVFETIGQSYAPSDLTAYDQRFGVPPQTVSKVIGPNNPSACSANPNNCVEAELDVQVITAIAQDGDNVFWSIPGDESFLQWIDAVASDPTPPLVHSISYGAPESDEPAAQAKNFDAEVSKMGARGLTVFVASGDDGVAGAGARGNSGACGFNPSYPATASHVTAVGATQGPESGEPEIACQSNKGGGITSGGGFSNVYSRPSWQSAAVEAYLSNPSANLPPSSMFNEKGRGYPDVAAMGHNYPIAVGGNFYAGSGTSASTPLVAGMTALANNARIAAGKKSLGFLNPALYQFDSSVFNDITSGENNCAAGNSAPVCCTYGFTATTGWDPVTGLGSPHFPKFLAAAMALP